MSDNLEFAARILIPILIVMLAVGCVFISYIIKLNNRYYVKFLEVVKKKRGGVEMRDKNENEVITIKPRREWVVTYFTEGDFCNAYYEVAGEAVDVAKMLKERLDNDFLYIDKLLTGNELLGRAGFINMKKVLFIEIKEYERVGEDDLYD